MGWLDNIGKAQSGRSATRQDSLDVYNRASDIEKYYKDRKYVKGDSKKTDAQMKKGIDFFKKEIATGKQYAKKATTDKESKQRINKNISKFQEIVNTNTANLENRNPKNYLKGLEGNRKNFKQREVSDAEYKDIYRHKDKSGVVKKGLAPFDEFYSPVDEDKFMQREQSFGNLDLRSPMPLYDKRITPQKMVEYNSPDLARNVKGGDTDRVEMYQYDPLAVKPFDMLSPEEKVLRVKKFGNSGVPQSYLDNPQGTPKSVVETPPIPVIAPVVSTPQSTQEGYSDVYYNTNPSRGPVEKPGNELGRRYIPVSNSAELAKWKQQNMQNGAQFEGTTNKGFNYNGAWGGQFQKGGKIKPLQVSSKDDPRYKAHQDSLALYQNYQQVKKELSKRDYKHLKNMPLNTPEYDNIIDEVRARLNRTGHEKPWKEYVKDVEKKKASTKKGNLYETSDFIRGVINPDLPSQLYSHTIQPTGTELYQHGAYPPEFHDWSEEQREVWKKQNKDKRYGDARVIANYSNVKPRQEVVIGKPTKKSEVKKEANATNSGYTLQHDGTKYYQSHIPKGKMEVEVVHSTGDRSTKFVDQPSKPKPKPRVREEAITSMSPRGIETHEGIDTPEMNLRPMAKPAPDYYDVRDVNPQTFGGYESRYRTDNPNDLRELGPENTREVLPHYHQRGLVYASGGGLKRSEDYGSKSHPYPSVAQSDFAGPHRSYPIPTEADAHDAEFLAKIHHKSDVLAKIHAKYPNLHKGQNGGWLDNLQDGDELPITYLPELTIPREQKEKGFWEQSRDKFIEENKGSLGSAMMAPVTYPLGVAQNAMMYGLTGKVQDPSEAWGFENEGGWFDSPTSFGKNLTNAALNVGADPLNLIGVGELGKLGKLGELSKGLERINPISGAVESLELPPQFLEEMRIQGLSESKNKQAYNVLNDMRERLKTPEGIRRAKELGIDNPDFLDKAKLIQDNTEYAYARGRDVSLHEYLPEKLSKTVTRHELEHLVQNEAFSKKLTNARKLPPAERMKVLNNQTTELDDILSNLELRREPKPLPERERSYKTKDIDATDLREKLSNKQDATDYFHSGSGGKEKSAFAAEAQQYMLDKGIIKHPYENITPEKVKEAFSEGYFDKENPIRLFHIMKANDKNYGIISKALNKMLTVTAIGAAASQVDKKQEGGIITDEMGQWTHPGEITRIPSNDITMKGVPYPVLGVPNKGKSKMMQPGMDYKFPGASSVTEYPKGKNGKELDQLTNFTNYNKPTKGGWLDKL